MRSKLINDWAGLGKVSILSVEDDSFNQELASAVFAEFEDIRIIQASNGKEALVKLSEMHIDAILLDLMMPEMNGCETLEAIKGNDKYKSIPVIVVTSKEEEKRRTYKLGANDFISKPYSPTELKLRVFNHLNIKRFSDLIDDIQDNVKNDNASSALNMYDLRESLRIADSSKKQLLSQLGALSHSNIQEGSNNSKRLGEYVTLLSKLYGLNTREIDNIFHSMSIYDIGLLRISQDKLMSGDINEYKTHPMLGLLTLNGLEDTNLVKMAKIITLNHHENWDGSGYPNRVEGEVIPIYARIATIADYFDELTVARVYNENILNDLDALEIMKRDRGIKLDPNLLDIFVVNFDKFRDIKNRLM
ncbi:MAG: response regulator [Sulfurovum sp.]|nr:response regulator [Sulfurovaceae bacterium]